MIKTIVPQLEVAPLDEGEKEMRRDDFINLTVNLGMSVDEARDFMNLDIIQVTNCRALTGDEKERLRHYRGRL